MSDEFSIAVFASGNGSNFQALVDAIASGRLTAEIRLLLTDQPHARVVARAHAAQVPVVVAPALPDRDAYADQLIAHCRRQGVQLICLAGFMRILAPRLLQAFPHRIINIHPSLLPQCPGLHAVQQALQAGVAETGCTVHFVDEGVDTGPVIAQRKVPIHPNDTEATLLARIHAAEHHLYPQVVQWFAEGRVAIRDGHVVVGAGS